MEQTDGRTDGRTNGSQHYLMPSPMGGHNKVVGNKYEPEAVIDYAVWHRMRAMWALRQPGAHVSRGWKYTASDHHTFRVLLHAVSVDFSSCQSACHTYYVTRPTLNPPQALFVQKRQTFQIDIDAFSTGSAAVCEQAWRRTSIIIW